MTERSETTDEFEALKRRWREEPSPALALRLAEEHGRRRQYEPAVEVLRRGLEARPGHLSARVALGRYLLELERPAESAAELERVVTEDPTHLVANKLLVRAYSHLGERAKAVDRLDLYTLLNEGDPELEELKRMTEAAASPSAESGATADAEAESAPSTATTGGASPEPDESPFEPVGVAEPPAAPAAPHLPPPPAEPSPAAATVDPSPVVWETTADSAAEAPSPPPATGTVAAKSEPFPDLWSQSDARRYTSALAAEGIFELERPASGGVETAPEMPPPPAQAAPIDAMAGEIVDSSPVVEEEPPSRAPAGEVFEPWPGPAVDEASVPAPREIAAPPPTDVEEAEEAAGGEPAVDAAVSAPTAGGLRARDLLDTAELELAPVERKRALLRHYLTRIRSAESADV